MKNNDLIFDYMITIKYKGKIVDLKDIEITWQEETYREWWGDGQPRTKIGTKVIKLN